MKTEDSVFPLRGPFYLPYRQKVRKCMSFISLLACFDFIPSGFVPCFLSEFVTFLVSEFVPCFLREIFIDYPQWFFIRPQWICFVFPQWKLSRILFLSEFITFLLSEFIPCFLSENFNGFWFWFISGLNISLFVMF